MALDPISVGSADDDGTGDALRTAFTKVNANDSYLEGLIAARGKNWKPYVRAATTANISLATDLEAGDALDGVTLAEGDRVLVKDQTAGAENGIYDVPASGAASRSDDSDTGDELLLAAVLVSEGTVNADKLFVCTTDAPITVDATSLTWEDRTQAGIAEAPNDGQEYVRKNEDWAVATGGGGGVASGTAFPGSPTTGDRFYRTDRNIDYFYDGTRWLSTQEYHISLTAPNGGASATAVYYSDVPFLGTHGIYLERHEGVFFRSATATWNISLSWRNAASVDTVLDTQSASGGTNGNWIDYSNDLSAVLDPTAQAFFTIFSEVSGTATLIARASLIYRLVG